MKAINRFLIAVILVLIALILEKANIDSPLNIKTLKKEVEKNINILEISKIYSSIFSYDENLIEVSKNYLKCERIIDEKTYKRIKINEELVPVLKEGLVVFIGNKDELGKTVIIKDYNGNEFYYGNIKDVYLFLYQNAKSSEYVGIFYDNEIFFRYLDKFGNMLDEKSFFYL